MADELNEPRDRVPLKVRRKWMIADGTVGLELQRMDAAPVMPTAPGSHIELTLPGTDGKALLRHYSLCNAPDELDHYVLAVKRDPCSRGGSAYLHDHLGEGDLLLASEPRNQFALAEGASRHVLIAGGIGITPLLAMAQYLHAQGDQFELHYFARALQAAAFLDRLSRFATSYSLHLGLTPEETEAAVAATVARADANTHVYACGPAPLIAVVERLAGARLRPDQFHHEYFAAPRCVVDDAAGAFRVESARTGAVFDVPADQTIVQALEAAGHAVAIACEQGVCGTCLTRVLAGTPDHRDAYLNAAERARGDQMLICVSRALSPTLILDL
ncbi:vanillate O-demethylase ferredoxin subunit [Pseudoduganella lurida]|uniref:Vanillate O-demethylase ferredoxin subunit n=1 Tax=Pseudoduganella lurida TaxID=1036180 RepID=A0A562R163_9BURK|nr:PDR/VanB family oxidoreductase [Pseudoduganella lurida]TWI62573.1 vanillate O-demethylase ferredoxin subunit [Pseudoduganella lurida]